MLIVLLAIVVMIAGPIGVQYVRNPAENIVTQSKLDATTQIREAVQELHTNINVVVEDGLQGALQGLVVALWSKFVAWFTSFFN